MERHQKCESINKAERENKKKLFVNIKMCEEFNVSVVAIVILPNISLYLICSEYAERSHFRKSIFLLNYIILTKIANVIPDDLFHFNGMKNRSLKMEKSCVI